MPSYSPSNFNRVRGIIFAPTIDCDLFSELDKAVSVLARNHRCILTKRCPVEYWHYLLSSVHLDGHPLKSCVNTIHVDAVEIWNLNDRTEVGFLPCLLRLLLMGTSIFRAMDSKLRYLNSSVIKGDMTM